MSPSRNLPPFPGKHRINFTHTPSCPVPSPNHTPHMSACSQQLFLTKQIVASHCANYFPLSHWPACAWASLCVSEAPPTKKLKLPGTELRIVVQTVTSACLLTSTIPHSPNNLTLNHLHNCCLYCKRPYARQPQFPSFSLLPLTLRQKSRLRVKSKCSRLAPPKPNFTFFYFFLRNYLALSISLYEFTNNLLDHPISHSIRPSRVSHMRE